MIEGKMMHNKPINGDVITVNGVHYCVILKSFNVWLDSDILFACHDNKETTIFTWNKHDGPRHVGEWVNPLMLEGFTNLTYMNGTLIVHKKEGPFLRYSDKFEMLKDRLFKCISHINYSILWSILDDCRKVPHWCR